MKIKMTDLQQLALSHIRQMADELSQETTSLSVKLGINKEPFDMNKHTHPLSSKARDIVRWSDAILADEE